MSLRVTLLVNNFHNSSLDITVLCLFLFPLLILGARPVKGRERELKGGRQAVDCLVAGHGLIAGHFLGLLPSHDEAGLG